VKPSIRRILADSHIAAVAIAVLLFRSFEFGIRSLGRPLFLVTGFLVDVVAVRGIPYGSGTFTLGEWLTLIPTFAYLSGTVISLAAALVLSRWVYGVGPFRSLSEYSTRLVRRNNA